MGRTSGCCWECGARAGSESAAPVARARSYPSRMASRISSRPAVDVRPVRNGRGLVALKSFAPGALVCRIKGTVVSSDQVWEYWDTDERMAANCIRYDAELYLNPRGEIGEFSNHSCRPNCGLFKEGRSLVLRAITAIAPEEEITHDYSTLLGADDIWTMRCNCGEARCRKLVRSFHTLPAATLRKYTKLGAIPAFILETQ